MPAATNYPPPAPLEPAIAAELEAIWLRLAQAIATTGVACQRSGRCCNFDQWDHTPFATTLELRHLISTNPLASAPEPGKLCPYWVDRACTAHGARPTGCRVFFCDANYQAAHSSGIFEQFHAEIRELCQRARHEYAYLPMVPAIRSWAREGRFYDPQRPFALMAEV